MVPQFDSSFGIITYHGKLLLILRDNNPDIPNPNTWSFIGGGADVGEKPEETYLREVKEEINLTLENPVFLCEFRFLDRVKYVFHTELTEGQVKHMKLGDEGQRLEFFRYDEVLTLPLARTTKRFIEERGELVRNLLKT